MRDRRRLHVLALGGVEVPAFICPRFLQPNRGDIDLHVGDIFVDECNAKREPV